MLFLGHLKEFKERECQAHTRRLRSGTSLLVAFKEHDAVVACFDEESQYMLEGSAEPTLGVVFPPQKPEEVRRALRVVGRFIALNHELFQLVEVLTEWEKHNASTHLDRGEPSLRVA
jgi:hypothetical protein